MATALLRNPLRRAAFAASVPRAARSRPSFRQYTTQPPPPQPAKSNIVLYAGLSAALVAAGTAFYFYTDTGKEIGTAAKSGVQVAKVKTKFTPTKEDYQKVLHAPNVD